MDDVCRRHGIEPKFAEMNAAPIKLYGDNDAATAAAKEIRLSAKSRHTRLKYHMIRAILDELWLANITAEEQCVSLDHRMPVDNRTGAPPADAGNQHSQIAI